MNNKGIMLLDIFNLKTNNHQNSSRSSFTVFAPDQRTGGGDLRAPPKHKSIYTRTGFLFPFNLSEKQKVRYRIWINGFYWLISICAAICPGEAVSGDPDGSVHVSGR